MSCTQSENGLNVQTYLPQAQIETSRVYRGQSLLKMSSESLISRLSHEFLLSESESCLSRPRIVVVKIHSESGLQKTDLFSSKFHQNEPHMAEKNSTGKRNLYSITGNNSRKLQPSYGSYFASFVNLGLYTPYGVRRTQRGEAQHADRRVPQPKC